MERQNTRLCRARSSSGRLDGPTPTGEASFIPRAGRAIFTKQATWLIFLTPLKSIRRFTSRSGRRLRRNGSTAWQLIPGFSLRPSSGKDFTHETSATVEDEQAVRAGFAPLAAAGKLAAVLLQFPFSFHRTPENFVRLTNLLDRFQDYQLVVEIRHSSWNDPEFYALLEERHTGFCNIDQPIIGRSIRPSEHVTAPVGYIRLHGRRYDTWFSDDPASPPEERYNYLYSEAELAPWAARIRKLAKHTRTTFVITNNHFEGKGVVNALQLIHLLSGTKVRVPEPLRHQYPELEAIADAPAEEPTLFPNPPR
jgi:uncharacterized protein YecE (DUF72 family)